LNHRFPASLVNVVCVAHLVDVMHAVTA